jgi:hypothetical protein
MTNLRALGRGSNAAAVALMKKAPLGAAPDGGPSLPCKNGERQVGCRKVDVGTGMAGAAQGAAATALISCLGGLALNFSSSDALVSYD